MGIVMRNLHAGIVTRLSLLLRCSKQFDPGALSWGGK
jgi:hypothetical protein